MIQNLFDLVYTYLFQACNEFKKIVITTRFKIKPKQNVLHACLKIHEILSDNFVVYSALKAEEPRISLEWILPR